MQITLEPPEDIAQGLGSRWKDLPRLLSYEKPVFAGRARGSTKTTVSRRRPEVRLWNTRREAGRGEVE